MKGYFHGKLCRKNQWDKEGSLERRGAGRCGAFLKAMLKLEAGVLGLMWEMLDAALQPVPRPRAGTWLLIHKISVTPCSLELCFPVIPATLTFTRHPAQLSLPRRTGQWSSQPRSSSLSDA